MKYRQSKNAIIISYVTYKWIIAFCTLGLTALFDYLNYKNTVLFFGNSFVTFENGAFTTRTKEIPYEDIMSISAEQSFLGKLFRYGTVTITMKNMADSIQFKYVNNPGELRVTAQSRFIASNKLKMV